MYEAKKAAHKVKRIEELAALIDPSPIVGIVNMENIPAPQLQRMRRQLKDKMLISMAKKSVIGLALDKSEHFKKGVVELKKFTSGMPALVFTNENPFRLASILRKSKTFAPAKPGQTAPRDIVIPAGPTPFAPGPIISELSGVGLKTGVEGGKVTIRQDHLLVSEGEKIEKKVAEVMTKLGIQPMEIGLDLVAIYERGVIYTRDVLSVDEQFYIDSLKSAAAESHNLSILIAYPTVDNIKALVQKAFNESKALAISKDIISDVVVQKMIVDAERQVKSVKEKLPADLVQELENQEKKSASDEAEVDKKIEQLKHEKEMEEIKKTEAIAHEILTKGSARKLDDADKNAKEQDKAEHLYDELKKKGTLRK